MRPCPPVPLRSAKPACPRSATAFTFTNRHACMHGTTPVYTCTVYMAVRTSVCAWAMVASALAWAVDLSTRHWATNATTPACAVCMAATADVAADTAACMAAIGAACMAECTIDRAVCVAAVRASAPARLAARTTTYHQATDGVARRPVSSTCVALTSSPSATPTNRPCAGLACAVCMCRTISAPFCVAYRTHLHGWEPRRLQGRDLPACVGVVVFRRIALLNDAKKHRPDVAKDKRAVLQRNPLQSSVAKI
ncbi:hypothetical protein Taro_030828 [Colocasia esculenta]|uniref:Uncharacterized protein n=1 Tax=Colocasia esculenta TaxID=4460 RepID=A0A843VV27_COLES|nr:hypothetical protein [Colocasia esculenta]